MESDKKIAVLLSPAERADVCEAMQRLAEQFEDTAEDLQPHMVMLRTHLTSKAARFRQLAALFAVLLCGCMEQGPPPYKLYFAKNVPEADREVFVAAAADWNAGVGEPVFVATDEPHRGRCGVEVAEVANRPSWTPAESFNGTCGMRVEYARGRAEKCVAVHELGHRLLEHHVSGTVMDARGCDYEPVVTPGLARRVRERWGL